MVSAIRLRHESQASEADRQSASLAALAVTLMIVVAGLWLIDALRAQAGLQDCVLSGRVGCQASVLF